MSAVYRWKPAAHVSIDAQLAGEELERIKLAHNGRLEAEFVVDEMLGDERNVLRGHFTLDVEQAARERWLDQAGHLIRCIELMPSPEMPEATPIRAFVSVVDEEERFYVSTVDALSDPGLRAQVLSQAWRELEAWRQRHAELTEFAKIFSTIDKARPDPKGKKPPK
jgi:hypothetical protein